MSTPVDENQTAGNHAAHIERDLRLLQGRLDRLTDAIIDGSIDKTAYDERRETLIHQRLELQERQHTGEEVSLNLCINPSMPCESGLFCTDVRRGGFEPPKAYSWMVYSHHPLTTWIPTRQVFEMYSNLRTCFVLAGFISAKKRSTSFLRVR